jgi:hypothetical protein
VTDENTSPYNSDRLETLAERQDKLVDAVNQIGENVAWLVANTQGIFQMFNDPKLMSSMMNGVLGGGLAGLSGQQQSNTNDDNSES